MKPGRKAKKRLGVFTAGNKLARLREFAELSQSELAEKMGVSRGTISSYETRINASPSAEAVAKLAKEFGIDLNWFYDGQDTPPTQLADEKPKRKPHASVNAVYLLRAETEDDGAFAYIDPLEEEAPLPLRTPRETEWLRYVPVVDMRFGMRAPQGSLILFTLRMIPPIDSLTLIASDDNKLHLALFSPPEGPDGAGKIAFIYPQRVQKREMPHSFGYVATAIAIVKPYRSGKANIEFANGEALVFTEADFQGGLNEGTDRMTGTYRTNAEGLFTYRGRMDE